MRCFQTCEMTGMNLQWPWKVEIGNEALYLEMMCDVEDKTDAHIMAGYRAEDFEPDFKANSRKPITTTYSDCA